MLGWTLTPKSAWTSIQSIASTEWVRHKRSLKWRKQPQPLHYTPTGTAHCGIQGVNSSPSCAPYFSMTHLALSRLFRQQWRATVNVLIFISVFTDLLHPWSQESFRILASSACKGARYYDLDSNPTEIITQFQITSTELLMSNLHPVFQAQKPQIKQSWDSYKMLSCVSEEEEKKENSWPFCSAI
jgi:hypothetical protein